MKVQHKQIRPQDQQHRDNPQGFYGGGGGMGSGGDGNFQRSGYPSHLPPSGPMAAAQSPWHNHPQQNPGGGDVGGDPNRPPEMNADNANPPSSADGAPDSGVVMPDNTAGLSPLGSLEPLRNALPEVPGND